MIKKIISLFLSVIVAFSLCNTYFALDWAEEYDVFMLPVISDKLPDNQQTVRIEVYLDKTEDIAFVSLDDICKIIDAKCSQEESRYAVKRDAVYFSYNGKDNMELYLLEQNSTSAFVDGVELAVELAVGSIIHDEIIGHRLLNGNLFESRKINDKWYVDYIRFCDMFGIKLSKYTSNNHNNLNGLVQTLDIVLENDVQFDFDSNPYYVRMYSGTTLSSIYQKVMRNRKTYLFDFYTFEIKNNNFWDNVLQKSGAMYQLASLQYKNILSNLINDWNGFTSALIDQYEPGEHYTESLLNILNTNYLKYVIQNHGSDKSIPTFSDFIECVANFYSDLLDNLLDNEPTWIADALTYNENLENYIEFFNALAENNNDYSKALESMAGIDDLAPGLSAAKIVLNSVSAFTEVHNTFKQINNLSSDKMTLLQKGIFENEKLETESSKINISGVVDKISRTANIINPVGAFDMAGNYIRKASQNFENNAKGLIDSARKIYDTYGKIGEQNFEKLKEVLKTSVYTAIDEGAQLILNKFPETVPVAVAMSAIDGAMALGKFAIGEELKDAENFVQYYYIEQNLLCNLNEWDPEKLHSNLTFALMASLCCYESQKKVMENDLKKITENKEIDLPEEYFQRIEEQRKEFDNSINQIAEVLYQLDYQKTQLCIDYYHDPRNNNVDDNTRRAIFDYGKENSRGTICGKVLTESKKPAENVKIAVYTESDNQLFKFVDDECYTNSKGEFSISMPQGQYVLIVTCDGYNSVNVKNISVEKTMITRVDDIILKAVNSSSMSGNIVKADNVYYYLGYDDQSNLNLYQGGSDMKDAVKADSVISFSDLSIYGENDFADLYVYGSKIYYNKIKDFYCYDTASGKVSKVQTGRLLDLCDDFLVYSVDSGQEFYKYNLRTNAAQLIKKFNAPFAEYKGFFDDKIFLCSEPGANLTFDRISLYYFDSDNKEHTIDLHDVSERIKGSGSSESMELGNFVHYKNRIYFIAVKLSTGSLTSVADSYLVSMNLDGSDIKYTHIDRTEGNKTNISDTSQIDYISNNEVYIANGKINIDSRKITYTGKFVRYSSQENVLYTENDSWYLANNDFSDSRKITDEKTYKKSVSGAESIYGISYGILDHYLLMNIGCKTFQNAGWKGKTIKYVHSVFDLNTLDNYEENFIQAIIDNESEWHKDNGSLHLKDMYFFDIDFDNKLEFLVKYGDNYNRIYITEVYYYENGLKKYRSPINDGMSRFEVFLDTKNKKHILRGENHSGTMLGGGGTHYFDIEIDRNSSKSTLYAYYSWSRNPSSPDDITFTYYKYDNVTYTTLEEAFNLAIEITEDEYNKIMIEKSENLVPIYVYSDEIEIQKYNKCSYAQKKDLLENAYNSVEYQEHSDQIQYYNGKHYYTPSLTVLGGGSGSYDFSQVGADYAALLELNIMHDEYQRVKIDNFIIVNDVIYFTNKYMKNGPGTDTADLYKCDMNGGSVTKIAESVYDNFHYMNGNIYFKTNNNQFDGTEDKEQCYSISTGKITDADFSFASYNRQGRFSPFSLTDSSIEYYCGGMYYQMPNDDEEVIRTEKANMFIHRVDKNGKDVIVGKWMSQIR